MFAHFRQHSSAAVETEAKRLVETYSDLILRLCYSTLGNTSDAEDICQETLIKAMRHTRPFEDAEHERAWIIRVALNACRDLIRRHGIHPTVSIDDIDEVADGTACSEQEFRRGNQSVLSAVMALPERQRIAIFLHYYANMSMKQIASITDSTPGAVAQNLSRGRASLRSTLKGDFHE